MKEIRLIRIALANLEPLVDYIINQAQEMYNRLLQLQIKYNNACAEIEKLKENDRQNSNSEESSSRISEISTGNNVENT